MSAKPAASSSLSAPESPNTHRVTREWVWKRLGAPTDQVGSVNDPRLRDEHGVRWNEKWIYRGEDGRSVARVVLWNRYDFLGVFGIAADGRATPEPLPE